MNEIKTNRTLLDELASVEFLTNAWTLLRKDKEESHGYSGVTIGKYSQNLDSNISRLNRDLLGGNFRFSPTRAAIIKKDNGKYRPLQIPEIWDRVVLKALSILLERELVSILSNNDEVSFAYQQGKGVREAVLKMKALSIEEGKEVILKVDIINFFEEVQKDELLNSIVFPNLKDNSISKLIEEAMSQKLKGLNRFKKEQKLLFKNAGKGIPQGNPLSPLLSNVYLSDFDQFLQNKGYSAIRYADDFIVLFQSIEEAAEGYELIRAYLIDNCGLRIHPLSDNNNKTEIVLPKESDFSFLSVKFDGNEIYPGKSSLGYLKSKIAKTIRLGELNEDLYKELHLHLDRWIALYSYMNIERYFKTIDDYVLVHLKKKFGSKKFKVTKCWKLARNRRHKQMNNGKNSWWKGKKINKLLPKIFQNQKN